MSKPRDVSNMPVMRHKCHSCPFGPNGAADVRATVEARLLTVSQTCHSTGAVKGKPDTHLCRGARDVQLKVMHRLGVISAPTDAAWRATWKKISSVKRK